MSLWCIFKNLVVLVDECSVLGLVEESKGHNNLAEGKGFMGSVEVFLKFLAFGHHCRTLAWEGEEEESAET